MNFARHDQQQTSFASDNYSGVHPEVLAALGQVNGGHVSAYGADPYTEALGDVMRRHFGAEAVAWPVLNGTGANVVALQAVTQRWESVIAAASAHINVDECAAVERMAGVKIHPVPTPDGKLTPALVESVPVRAGDQHWAQIKVVSFSNSTELGTVYSPDEVAELARVTHERGWVLHCDGSRLSNAAAAQGVSLGELTAAVDILSLGGTKNGAMLAEAVVVLNPKVAQGVEYLRKQSMQLASKMRFVSAQLLALYGTDLWQRNAEHANAMAAYLAQEARAAGVKLAQESQANAVFPVLDAALAQSLMQRWPFYDWEESAGVYRWMCSWDTTREQIDSLIAALGSSEPSATPTLG